MHTLVRFIAAILIGLAPTLSFSQEEPKEPLGKYKGRFTNNVSYDSFWMEATLATAKAPAEETKEKGLAVSGSITLNTGHCDGVKRTFNGFLKDGLLNGKTEGPTRCGGDLTLTDVKVSGNTLDGLMSGTNPYTIKLTRQ